MSLPYLDGLSRSAIEWPNALEYPLFYVGIYAAIRLGSVSIDVCSVFAKYKGSLRASTILFE